jgi:hypothetical protein
MTNKNDLSHLKKLYHSLVHKNNKNELRKLLTELAKTVLYKKPTNSQKQFYEYLWSFYRSVNTHPHRFTNDVLGNISNTYHKKLSSNIKNDQDNQYGSSPKTPKRVSKKPKIQNLPKLTVKVGKTRVPKTN